MGEFRQFVARSRGQRVGPFTMPQFIFLVTGLALAGIVFATGLSVHGVIGSATPTVMATPTAAPVAVVVTETATPVATPTTVVRQPTATVSPSPSSTPTPVLPTPTPTIAYRTRFEERPLVVMIENHPDARPQSGLSEADVVYEAVAEWGITRFMAVFANDQATTVGPVRSARHYFVRWADEFNGLFAFAGASPQGYAEMSGSDLWTIDYTYGEGNYWRSDHREAPHNLYAETDDLRVSARDAIQFPSQLGGLTFRNREMPGTPVSSLVLVYPLGYTVGYTYSPRNQTWTREMEGYVHVDANTGEPHRPTNVVVQIVETWQIRGDTAGRMDMELTGSGTAYLFSAGKVIEGRWIKPRPAAYTQFVDDDGRVIDLLPGQTWIQILPDNGTLRYR
ncbi:MAG TPA: DUF3048 domain-containing protein [Chloroflexota bacterium]|nr:DUF3048 domain-containing protein [Chloroflexota bacterium]